MGGLQSPSSRPVIVGASQESEAAQQQSQPETLPLAEQPVRAPGDGAITVGDRILPRILLFSGIPVALGLLTLPGFYYLKVRAWIIVSCIANSQALLVHSLTLNMEGSTNCLDRQVVRGLEIPTFVVYIARCAM